MAHATLRPSHKSMRLESPRRAFSTYLAEGKAAGGSPNEHLPHLCETLLAAVDDASWPVPGNES